MRAPAKPAAATSAGSRRTIQGSVMHAGRTVHHHGVERGGGQREVAPVALAEGEARGADSHRVRGAPHDGGIDLGDDGVDARHRERGAPGRPRVTSSR
jgi:hypothetical protein